MRSTVVWKISCHVVTRWWVLPWSSSASLPQLGTCEFIKSVWRGLCGMLTSGHEIVLLKHLTTGLLTFKYYSGQTAGDKR